MQIQRESERTKRIIEHLKSVWNESQPLCSDDLKRITEFVLSLPEQYKPVALALVAEHVTSSMSMHVLNLMALFQQNASQEGISIEDVEDTFNHIFPDAFKTISNLAKNVQVQSLEDMTSLASITVNLQTLSLADTAEDAQSWLYELPNMYYQQLLQEKLIGNKPIHIIPMEIHKSDKSTNWISQKTQGYIYSGITDTRISHHEKTSVA